MALELLTADEATTKPAGRGREDPNQNPTLEEPKYVKVAARFSIQIILTHFLFPLVDQLRLSAGLRLRSKLYVTYSGVIINGGYYYCWLRY